MIRPERGLEKFPHLVELAGNFLDHSAAFERRPQFGLHPDLPDYLQIPRFAALVTTANYASFNLYAREVMMGREAELFTSNWPGLGEAGMIRRLAARTEGVFHWGDIEMAGAAIANAVWRASGRDISLHLMDPEIAAIHGNPAAARRISVDDCSPAAPLMALLVSPDGIGLGAGGSASFIAAPERRASATGPRPSPAQPRTSIRFSMLLAPPADVGAGYVRRDQAHQRGNEAL